MNSSATHPRSLLACLGDASRFELVRCLIESEQCVTELAVQVGLSQSCTTRHLQALQRLGLVHGQRDGKRVVFRLRREEPRVTALLEWALRGAASVEPGGAQVHREVGSLELGAGRMAGPSRRRSSETDNAGPVSGSGRRVAGPTVPGAVGAPIVPSQAGGRSGMTGPAPQVGDSAGREARLESDDTVRATGTQGEGPEAQRAGFRRDGDLEDYLL